MGRLTDINTTHMLCFVIPALQVDGTLPAGVHVATWTEIETAFGGSAWRKRLLRGLRAALASLKAAGCPTAYIDGSFVTAKKAPGDFDACWEMVGVDATKLDPVLLDFSNKRARQKAKFGGELFPAGWPADATGMTFVRFFQVDKQTGNPKGIVAIDLGKWKP